MIKIYYYWVMDDYVFKFPGDRGYGLALSDSGMLWYALCITKEFELMGEI